jgi:superfamily II DNA or RNA helicase
LQGKRVLSYVDFEEIDGASKAPMTDDEVKEFSSRFGQGRSKSDEPPWLPPGVEQRLSEDPARHSRILERLLAIPGDCPTIVFATTVEDAEGLAADLNARGRSAAAVSHKTDRRDRTECVGAFKKGITQFLVNFAVFATGFDAPKVRVICIARPTFSRVLYQQMIGRGLRGPLNGGTERCLILNVRDNLGRFGVRIAFRHFEPLWANDRMKA